MNRSTSLDDLLKDLEEAGIASVDKSSSLKKKSPFPPPTNERSNSDINPKQKIATYTERNNNRYSSDSKFPSFESNYEENKSRVSIESYKDSASKDIISSSTFEKASYGTDTSVQSLDQWDQDSISSSQFPIGSVQNNKNNQVKELDDDNISLSSKGVIYESISVAKQPDIGTAKRCTRVVLSGSNIGRGHRSSAFSKCVCDNLRCLHCNFQVCCFVGVKWDPVMVDYMFVRNNVPSSNKLSKGLLSSRNSSAYCCQCTWVDTEVEQTLALGNSEQPNWVCGGHS